MKTTFLAKALLSLTLLAAASGCGGSVYRPPARVELDPAEEINDEDVKKAFEAKPQLRSSFHVAYYVNDAAKAAEIEAMLKGISSIKGTYRIPSLMASGQGRLDEGRSWDAPKPVSVKKLRLLAARAHADVLLVFDAGHRTSVEPNGYAALNILLVPMLVAPWLDAKVESTLDAFVIDVRNGYLYGHAQGDEKTLLPEQTAWSKASRRAEERQWSALVSATRARLVHIFDAETKGTKGQDAKDQGPHAGGSALLTRRP